MGTCRSPLDRTVQGGMGSVPAACRKAFRSCGPGTDQLDIYYTFDNTDPDSFTPKYETPLRIPKNATWLRIVTYRDNKPIGKVITLTIKELEKRAGNTRHVVGNL